MHIVRAALPAAPTTMPRTCVRNVEWALPNIRFNVTNCTNQLHLVRRQTWVEHPDEQLHWRHGACGPRPSLAQPRMNIAWGLGSTATTASHRKYIYTRIYIFIRRAPLAILCMARTMQRYAVGDVANNRTCNGGRVANTVWLPTWNGGSQPCIWHNPNPGACKHALQTVMWTDALVARAFSSKPAIPRLGGAGLTTPESLALVENSVPSGRRGHASRLE